MPDQETPDVLGEALRRAGHLRQFAAGQALFVEGDGAERVFVIESGWVLLSCAAPDGREVVLGLRGPGDVIGDMSILDGEPRSATALALDPLGAIVAPASALTAALADAGVAQAMIRVLAARLRDADRKRVEFSALDTLGRVAWRLLELSERFGTSTDDGIVVELPLSQEQLASWCGSSREATVKALASLRGLGTITTGRRRVVITSAEALARHAGGLAGV
ncbi:MAG TPA: Crp/Fnr family transcriptional regulator [Solirubrobacteraceae bacterium]